MERPNILIDDSLIENVLFSVLFWKVTPNESRSCFTSRDLLDTFPQIKHEQSWTNTNRKTILIEPQKAWLDRNHIKNIFRTLFYLRRYFVGHKFFIFGHFLKCFDVESLPVSLTATYSMHPLFKPCCFERLFESGICGRITLWYNSEILPLNQNWFYVLPRMTL